MATNVEIKARVHDWQSVRAIAEQLSQSPGELLLQEDTFFPTPQGRLKLRVLAPGKGQLIYYKRPDTPGPKRSDYLVVPTSEPDALKAVLAASLGVRGVVRKRRWLYLVGYTRIHLDVVEGLGRFLELEVMLQPGQSEEEGAAMASDLLLRLGIAEQDLLPGAYMDLLEPRL